MVKALLDRGADVNAVTTDKTTALHVASVSNYLEIVTLLLDRGANVNAIANSIIGGITPLMLATLAKHEAVITLLRARGGR